MKAWWPYCFALQGILGTIVLPTASPACSCGQYNSATEMLGLSDVVFFGTATDLTLSDDGYVNFVTFEVAAYWKDTSGEFARTVVVCDWVGPAWCEAGLVPEGQWLVFADEIGAHLATDECKLTTTKGDAEVQGYFTELGKPLVVVGNTERSWGAVKAVYK